MPSNALRSVFCFFAIIQSSVASYRNRSTSSTQHDRRAPTALVCYAIAMGEAARRSRARAKILADEPRCIYCATSDTSGGSLTLEHMPPIALFRDRHRPNGMEFACCEPCNVGTKGADVAATVFSLISPRENPTDWKLGALDRVLPALQRYAPGLRREVMSSELHYRWLWTPRGLIKPHVRLRANGPLLAAYLSVFSAKLAMALYREHVGAALPLDGAAYTVHFLNSGLAQAHADAMLSIMPIFGRLDQGRNNSAGQFEYRFNCDKRSIIAALVSFHHNLRVMLLATSDPALYGPAVAQLPHMRMTRPGELVPRLEAARNSLRKAG